MKLQELAQYGFGVAKATIEKGSEVVPVFLVVTNNDDIGIIMAPWNSDDEKIRTFQAMRQLFEGRNVKAYVFVSECWVVKASNESPWDGTMPSQHPERVDVLMIDGHTRDGESYSLMVEIDHRADGSRVVTKEPERMEGVQSGRAVNLLKPEVSETQH